MEELHSISVEKICGKEKRIFVFRFDRESAGDMILFIENDLVRRGIGFDTIDGCVVLKQITAILSG